MSILKRNPGCLLYFLIFIGFMVSVFILSQVGAIEISDNVIAPVIGLLWFGGSIMGLILLAKKKYLALFSVIFSGFGCISLILFGWIGVLLALILLFAGGPFIYFIAALLPAYINCPSCTEIVSEKATRCPHCTTHFGDTIIQRTMPPQPAIQPQPEKKQHSEIDYKEIKSNTGTDACPDETRHVIEVKDSKPKSEETYLSPGEEIYKGVPKDEPMLRTGTQTWPEGQIYRGEFKEGLRHGKGIYTWPNGTKYEGEWANGAMQGQGMMTSPNGARYTGDFYNNLKNGNGTWIHPDGSKYIGEWRDGKPNGQGTILYQNGGKHIGVFENGKRHGHGLFTYPDGRKLEGEWENGKLKE